MLENPIIINTLEEINILFELGILLEDRVLLADSQFDTNLLRLNSPAMPSLPSVATMEFELLLSLTNSDLGRKSWKKMKLSSSLSYGFLISIVGAK
ncbi:hypothetical protein CsSME_00006622 [Camellia sinensis var. sinensis]